LGIGLGNPMLVHYDPYATMLLDSDDDSASVYGSLLIAWQICGTIAATVRYWKLSFIRFLFKKRL
jgi:hypothetical protein